MLSKNAEIGFLQIIANRAAIIRVWLWTACLLIIFFLVAAVAPLVLSPVTVHYSMEVEIDWERPLQLQEAQTSLTELGVQFATAAESDGHAEAYALWSENRRFSWSAPSNSVQKVTRTLESAGLEVGGFSIELEHDQSYTGTHKFLWVLLVLVFSAFLFYQRRQRVYIDSSCTLTSFRRPLLLATLSSVPVLLIVAGLFQSLEIGGDFQVQYTGLTGAQLILLVLVWPLVEELLFRAWLLEALRRLMPPLLALMFTAIAFSVIHPHGVVGNVIFVLPGLWLGWLWLRYRSLVVCLVGHSTYNLCAIGLSAWGY